MLSFHQRGLAPETSRRLAIQTPWGLVEPALMPERISPAMGVPQIVVQTMYRDYESWMIVIFDNLLLLALISRMRAGS